MKNIFSQVVCAVLLAASSSVSGRAAEVGDNPIRGPFPLLCTPWTAEGALDTAVLAREAAFMSEKGAAGVIWPTAGEVADLVAEGEYVKGLEALAARAAQPGFAARLTAICPGGTSADALARVREVNAVQARHGIKMAILARPPDDAKTQANIEAHYRALAALATCPVIIQTYNGKSPQPGIDLIVRLARDYPKIYGCVKEESPGGQVNGRIAQLVAAKPVIKTVFSGWGAKGWLYQSRALGTDGMITQRPAYTDLLAAMWREQERGDPEGRLSEIYAKYLLMINLGDTFGSTADQMRGPHLYVLQRRGVFTNTCTRRRPKKGEDAKGRKWIVESYVPDARERAEIERRMAFCGILPAKEPLAYIDPLIGTEGTGSQYGGMMPMTGVPFGSVQWVPMTRLTEVGTLSYNEIDPQLLGFIAARQPAIWMGEWGQVSFMPRTGAVDCDFATRGVALDHAREKATPWKYTVDTDAFRAEMAGSSRAAIWRIAFRGERPHLVIDASRDYRKGPSDTRPADGALEIGADGRTVTGWNADRLDAHHADPLPNFRGWFAMEFSRPFTACGTYAGDPKSVRNPQRTLGAPKATDYQKVVATPGARAVRADRCGGWVEFAASDAPLFVKVGVSLISREQALENLKREIPGWDLDAVAARAKAAWAEKFACLRIETPRDDVKTIFYTGLYHALLYPREIGEYGRYYSAFDDRVHDGESYSCYSLWDTYRAEHPLLTLVAPERVDGMMRALLQNYREGGWLPKWPNPGYTGIMVGAPAEMVLAEAWSKGFRGFDVKLAYEAVKKNATVPQPTDRQFDWRDRGCFGATPETRAGLSWYQELGYVACDKVRESVSRTQDFCLNDTAAAILADAAGAPADAAFFRARSKCYTNLWNATARRFLPRRADGAWADPREGGHYCECSPETGLWCVPHDVEGLVALLGGPAAFEKELDVYFDTLFWKPERGNRSIHGNEPSHHTSYLYNYCGRPEKTARRVREILARSYSTNRKGFDGNEDCGQMSAWYILSALGFYPMNPATGWYEIGSPLVERATLRIGAPYAPATLEIVCRNQAPKNCRVASVTFNGRPLANRRIHHNELVKGGVLAFTMAR